MTIAQQLKFKEFPFIIRNKDGRVIYHEDFSGSWSKSEYNSDGNEIYFENSHGDWSKREYDSNGKKIYDETSGDIWMKRPKQVELTLEEIADKFDTNIEQLRIKG